MPGETKHGIECAEFDALLSDALDLDSSGNGPLSPARRAAFEAHRRVCPVCGPMFAEVQAGQQWLRTLALETVAPPVHLVHNILAATSGVHSTRALATATGSAISSSAMARTRAQVLADFIMTLPDGDCILHSPYHQGKLAPSSTLLRRTLCRR